MAIAGTVPVVWGLATGRTTDAVWITLTAEAVTWVELKGSFAWRLRTLFFGALLAISFAMVGSVTGGNIWLSVLCMLGTGFIATLLKSIGDRASGLGLCVYLLFILCNAYPATTTPGLTHRLLLVSIGAAWPLVVGLFVSLLMPAEEPFRRQIALIWRSVAALTEAVAKTGSGRKDNIFAKERNVRTAIDNSYQFYGRMAHQVPEKDQRQYQLAQLRKVAGLVSVNIINIGDEMDQMDLGQLDESLRLKAATLLDILREAIQRISIFVITLKPEEKLLAVSQINRMRKFIVLIQAYPLSGVNGTAMTRILLQIERVIKLLESAIQRVELMGYDAPVYRSYSFLKTLFVLRPKYLLRNLQVLFNLNTHTSRYAIRSALAAALALFIYKWYHVDHGYWLPFTVMIVIQPYFGATLKRALDRMAGTLLGGLAGSLLLYLPVGLHLKEGILFLTFIFMVYYLRKNYALAAFIITLNLVLLFNIESAFSNMVMVSRMVCTMGGALLAIGSGFILFPTWDRKWLPGHLAAAILCNYGYFMRTFYSPEPLANWTKQKRLAESKNSDVFDSFNRYIEEPGVKKTELFYSLITTNVRITRNLNNVLLEQAEKNTVGTPLPTQQQKIDGCRALFSDAVAIVKELYPRTTLTLPVGIASATPFELDNAQMRSVEKLSIELAALKTDLEQMRPRQL